MGVILAIGAGGFVGGILRYLIGIFVQAKFSTTYPLGTLAVNIVGCFLIGLVFGMAEKGSLTPEWKLFLATGLLGGFTTFSAFSIETIVMLRDGMLWSASAYILASIVLGLFATVIGISLLKIL